MQRKEVRLILAAVAFAVLLAGVFALRLFGGRAGTVAHIYIEGQEVWSLKLATVQPGVFSLREEYGVPVDFEIKNRRVRFVNVECPDHICERTGFVYLDGQTAVCMPNRTTVVITNS